MGGFLYSVDDTTNNGVTGACTKPPCTKSIGGKVASLTDQAEPYISSGPQNTSIIWSSDGNGAARGNVNYTAILGIDETSTTSVPSPTSPAYPLGTPAYTPCNGASDGACDSSNIVSYYNFNRTSGVSAPTPVAYYAAGLCTASINTYSDLGILKHYNTYHLRKHMLIKNLSAWWWNLMFFSGGCTKLVAKQRTVR